MSKFDQLTMKLAAGSGKAGKAKIRNPRALAASIGIKKYGKKGMARKAAAAREGEHAAS